MKKWLTFILVAILCLGTLLNASCMMLPPTDASTQSSAESSSLEYSSFDSSSEQTFAESSSLEDSSFDSSDEQSSAESSSQKDSSVQSGEVVLRFLQKTYDIEVGQSIQTEIEFTIDGEKADLLELGFASTNRSIASIDEGGVLTGVSSGTAAIRVWYGKGSIATATVNVIEKENRLELSHEYVALMTGEEVQVTATAHCGLLEITNPTLVWESANPSIATVESGKIKAIGYGKTKISVTYEEVTKFISVSVIEETTAENVNTFDEAYVNIFGRCQLLDNGLFVYHVASGIEVGVIGTSLTVNLYSSGDSYMRVFVDNDTIGKRIFLPAGTKEYKVASNLEKGRHTVRMVKCSEESNAYWIVKSFSADKFFQVPEKSDLKIEFIGDSITAGHGSIGMAGEVHTIGNSDAAKTYAYLTAHTLGADYSLIAWSGICTKAYHWGNSINMATLYERVSYLNKEAYNGFDADVVIINLGTNEASYISTPEGQGYAEQFPTDYLAFLQAVRVKNPNAYIICLYGMMGKASILDSGIRSAVTELGDEKIVYNPFKLTPDYAGANGHPGTTAHEEYSESLVAYIKTLDLE